MAENDPNIDVPSVDAPQAPPAAPPEAPQNTQQVDTPPAPPAATPAGPPVLAPGAPAEAQTKAEKKAAKAKAAAEKKAAKEKADAEKKAAAEAAALEAAKPFVSSGRALDVWSDSASTFIPSLKKDMSLAERKIAVRDCAKKAAAMDDKLNLVLGELLYEASENKYYNEEDASGQKFDTFEDYVQEELGMQKSKAHYLKSIYKTFVIELELPTETLRNLEWSKAKELTSVINKDNAVTLLDKISNMSVKKVQELVRGLKGKPALPDPSSAGTGAAASTGSPSKGGNVGEDEIKVPINFKCAPTQAENIQAALKLAETLSASSSPAHNLDLICTDFLAGSSGQGLQGVTARLDAMVKSIERTFGIKLQVIGHDKERFDKMKADEEAKAQAAQPAS